MYKEIENAASDAEAEAFHSSKSWLFEKRNLSKLVNENCNESVLLAYFSKNQVCIDVLLYVRNILC